MKVYAVVELRLSYGESQMWVHSVHSTFEGASEKFNDAKEAAAIWLTQNLGEGNYEIEFEGNRLYTAHDTLDGNYDVEIYLSEQELEK